jgi:hypothetical protein
MGLCEAEHHGGRKAWQSKVTHLWLPRSREMSNREKPRTRYTLQRKSDPLPPTKPDLPEYYHLKNLFKF